MRARKTNHPMQLLYYGSVSYVISMVKSHIHRCESCETGKVIQLNSFLKINLKAFQVVESLSTKRMDLYEITPFKIFYEDIRAFFRLNPDNFEQFKRNETSKEKILFLLTHKFVRDKIQTHLDWKCPLRKKPVRNEINYENDKSLNSKSTLLPYLSSSAKIAYSKRKGRHLIATKKISPGKYPNLKKFIILFFI